MNLAIELIDAGYLRGEILDRTNLGATCAIVAGITIAGREFLEKLKREKRERSWRGRMTKAIWAFWGWIVGLLGPHISDVSQFVARWWHTLSH